MNAMPDGYPTTVELDPPDHIANWRPLVHWLLAIPQMIVANALSSLAQALGFVAWLVIVFTGRLPAGLAHMLSMSIRYQARVWTYIGFLTEEYPPFDFALTGADPGGYPLRVDMRLSLEDRNRATVFFRLILAIPQMIVLAFVAIAAIFAYLIAFFAVLFTGRWPSGLLDFVVGAIRWSLRFQSWFLLLNDDYPPFALR